jgi:hypothetical protein
LTATGFPSLAHTLKVEKEERPLYLAVMLAYRPHKAFKYIPKAELDMPSSAEESTGRLADYLRRQLEVEENPVLHRALIRLGVADVKAQGDEVILRLRDGRTVELKVKYYSKRRVGYVYISKLDKETKELTKALEKAVEELVDPTVRTAIEKGRKST